MQRSGTNMVATPLMNLQRDKARAYLSLVPTSPVVVTISGGEPFTLEVGQVWGPIPAPINDITFTGTGTLIVG